MFEPRTQLPSHEQLPVRAVRLPGELLRRRRTEKGLTRERLAALSRGPDAISVATIKRAERGDPIYLTSATALARLLELPVESLLGNAGRDQPTPRPNSPQVTIAVLPFRALGSHAQARVFADGLVEDLTNRLGIMWFPVISRCSSFSFQELTSTLAEIGQSLDADYVVEGSVQLDRDRLRLTARLVEASSALQVWSSSYERSLSEVFTLQERLSSEIVSQIGGRVLAHQVERMAQQGENDLSGWRDALRGLWHFHRSTSVDNELARKLSLSALSRNPSIVLSRYVLLLTHQHDLIHQWTADPKATRQAMRLAARAFEAQAPGDAWMYVATAYACVAHGERDEAIARLEEALDLAPNIFTAHSLYGQVLAMDARPEQGLHELELARRLSPRDPNLWTVLSATALAHFVAERYADAVQWAEMAVRGRPHIGWCHAILAVAHALLGDPSAARAALQNARERSPGMQLRGFVPSFAATKPEIAQRFVAGLRMAGLSGDLL